MSRRGWLWRPHSWAARPLPSSPPLPPLFPRSFYYFLLPIYMWLKNAVWPRSGPLADKF